MFGGLWSVGLLIYIGEVLKVNAWNQNYQELLCLHSLSPLKISTQIILLLSAKLLLPIYMISRNELSATIYGFKAFPIYYLFSSLIFFICWTKDTDNKINDIHYIFFSENRFLQYPEWKPQQCVGLAYPRTRVRASLAAASLAICSQHLHCATRGVSTTKEDIDIEQQLYEIVRGKNFALNCLSWKFTDLIMITNEVIPENLVVVR